MSNCGNIDPTSPAAVQLHGVETALRPQTNSNPKGRTGVQPGGEEWAGLVIRTHAASCLEVIWVTATGFAGARVSAPCDCSTRHQVQHPRYWSSVAKTTRIPTEFSAACRYPLLSAEKTSEAELSEPAQDGGCTQAHRSSWCQWVYRPGPSAPPSPTV